MKSLLLLAILALLASDALAVTRPRRRSFAALSSESEEGESQEYEIVKLAGETYRIPASRNSDHSALVEGSRRMHKRHHHKAPQLMMIDYASITSKVTWTNAFPLPGVVVDGSLGITLKTKGTAQTFEISGSIQVLAQWSIGVFKLGAGVVGKMKATVVPNTAVTKENLHSSVFTFLGNWIIDIIQTNRDASKRAKVLDDHKTYWSAVGADLNLDKKDPNFDKLKTEKVQEQISASTKGFAAAVTGFIKGSTSPADPQLLQENEWTSSVVLAFCDAFLPQRAGAVAEIYAVGRAMLTPQADLHDSLKSFFPAGTKKVPADIATNPKVKEIREAALAAASGKTKIKCTGGLIARTKTFFKGGASMVQAYSNLLCHALKYGCFVDGGCEAVAQSQYIPNFEKTIMQQYPGLFVPEIKQKTTDLSELEVGDAWLHPLTLPTTELGKFLNEVKKTPGYLAKSIELTGAIGISVEAKAVVGTVTASVAPGYKFAWEANAAGELERKKDKEGWRLSTSLKVVLTGFLEMSLGWDFKLTTLDKVKTTVNIKFPITGGTLTVDSLREIMNDNNKKNTIITAIETLKTALVSAVASTPDEKKSDDGAKKAGTSTLKAVVAIGEAIATAAGKQILFAGLKTLDFVQKALAQFTAITTTTYLGVDIVITYGDKDTEYDFNFIVEEKVTLAATAGVASFSGSITRGGGFGTNEKVAKAL